MRGTPSLGDECGDDDGAETREDGDGDAGMASSMFLSFYVFVLHFFPGFVA